MDFSQVRKFDERKVRKGERYVFSAAFDVKPDLKKTERIDAEVADIKRISDSGGVAAILSHQGRLEYGDVIHLDFVAQYMSKAMGREVKYFPENNTAVAVENARAMKPGEIGLFGNVRFHQAEIDNSPVLAEQFASLGDFAVIGGFTKAHRKQASNCGILQYIPGFLAGSIVEQVKLLEPWEGRREAHSVAVLGGIKKEKIKALNGFAEIYDYIIPGGIALNTMLRVKGYNIGDSVIEDGGKTFEPEIRKILTQYQNKMHLPLQLMVSRRNGKEFEESRWIYVSEGVPQGFSIVDFKLETNAINELERAAKDGRIIVAGTPTIYKAGFKTAVNQVMQYVERAGERAILLGGDTVSEIPFAGTTSTGGGSALEYLCSSTFAVYEALRENMQRFSDV